MKIALLMTGKTDASYLMEGTRLYEERIKRYISYEQIVLPDLKNRSSLSIEQQKKMEAAQMIPKFQSGDFIVLLDENGKQPTSRAFAEFIEKQMISSTKRLVFVIGGPYGFAPEIPELAHQKISLSALTFSHQLVRLVFVEQLYRAFSIIRGEPYHHD